MSSPPPTSRMRLHPVNPAEAVLAAFFDPGLSPEKEWTLTPAPEARGVRTIFGYTLGVAWDALPPGAVGVTWSWTGRLDLTRYDGLYLVASFGTAVTLRWSACVDGRRQTIAEGRGQDAFHDYAGPFTGRVLEDLRLELIADTNATGTFSLYYLGAHHSGRLRDWLAFEAPDVYPEDWPEFIKPEAQWGEWKPATGLCFGAEDLDGLRQKLACEPYRALADTFRRQAREWLNSKPEDDIRQFLRCGPPPFAYGARDRDRGEAPWRRMEQCAFFGLLDRDPDLVRLAARYAVSLAHVGHWCEGYTEHAFPGSAANYRAFFQGMVAASLSCAMDWIGLALTPHAVEALRHALWFKALAPLHYDFARYDYIYEMNQACLLGAGRISVLLALRHGWTPRRVDWLIDRAEQDLNECAHRIVHADGGYGEGPGYFFATLNGLLFSYLQLGRFRGRPVAAMAPPGLQHAADYYGLFVATAQPAARLMVSDNTTPVLDGDALAMLAAATGDPRWNRLLVERLTVADPEAASLCPRPYLTRGSVRALIFGPDDLSRQAPAVPVFGTHAGAGHACSCRPTPHGPVRFNLCGAAADEGHSHEDKGALILEAFGEALLIDRGTPIYSDPAVGLLKMARFHNLVTPEDGQGQCCRQINPCPKPAAPEGRGDDRRVRLRIATTPAWPPEIVRRAVRVVASDDPLHLTLIDLFDLAVEAPVVFHLHTYAPVALDGHTATCAAERSVLRVTWEWPAAFATAEAELYDYAHRPVFHLAVRSPPARHHRLVTRLVLTPKIERGRRCDVGKNRPGG